MPVFSTPEPIAVDLGVVVADIRIVASDRVDTVVEVRPSNTSQEGDVRAAEQTRVDYSAGRLVIKTAKPGVRDLFFKSGSIDVTIELPAGSTLTAEGSMAAIHGTGRLGECRIKSATGDIRLEETGSLDLTLSAGSVVVGRVTGDAQITTGSGKVRVAEIAGNAVVKNGNGDSWIGEIAGELRVKAANGDISVDRTGSSVTAATANGEIRVGDAARGAASLKTANGEIEIGVRSGTAARLDAHTSFGQVRNGLSAADSPAATDETLEVRARTGYGDIVIRRA